MCFGTEPAPRIEVYTLDGNEAVASVATRLSESGSVERALVNYPGQERRFRMVEQEDQAASRELMATAERELRDRVALYETPAHLAVPYPTP